MACYVMVDLNYILHRGDRIRGNEIIDSTIKEFANCIEAYELEEI